MQAPFERLVRAHEHTVLRVARALVGPDDADDVWSENFLAALRAYPGLPRDANHQAWLVTITHRKAIDVLRARYRRPVPVDPQDSAAVPARISPGPAERSDILDLYAALDRLPAKQRHCVALHHLGGLPYREVAQQLGGSEVAARRAAADGVSALRRVLTDAERRPS